jgi:hypothetical protein
LNAGHPLIIHLNRASSVAPAIRESVIFKKHLQSRLLSWAPHPLSAEFAHRSEATKEARTGNESGIAGDAGRHGSGRSPPCFLIHDVENETSVSADAKIPIMPIEKSPTCWR